MRKKTLTELLSFEPSRELRLEILNTAKETGKSIEEICDRYAMPPLFVLNENGTFLYEGERMTSKEFTERFPYRRFVTVGTKERQEAKKRLTERPK